MISYSPQKSKKKLFLPMILILFLLGGFFIVQIKRSHFDFSFLSFSKKEMINPILPPTEEEKLRNLLEASGIKVETVGFLDNSLEATVSGNLEVLFSRKKDYSFQVASLQFILGRSKIEGKIPKKIDLRYNKPLLIY